MKDERDENSKLRRPERPRSGASPDHARLERSRADRGPRGGAARLGIDVPPALRFDVRVQRPDTLYLVIPPVSSDDAGGENVVNQMDLWRSGDQFVWILPQDAKTALLEMREQYRNRGGGEGR